MKFSTEKNDEFTKSMKQCLHATDTKGVIHKVYHNI